MIMGLKEIKEKFKLTDEEIADYVGVSRQTARQWRWMNHIPTMKGNHLRLEEMVERLEKAGVEKWYKGQAIDFLKNKEV